MEKKLHHNLHSRCSSPCEIFRLSAYQLKNADLNTRLPLRRTNYKRSYLSVSVLGFDEVCKGLGLLNFGAVVMAVVVILGANVIHLVNTATLRASLNGAVLGDLFFFHVSDPYL